MDIIARSPKSKDPFPVEVKVWKSSRLRERSGLVAFCRLGSVKKASRVTKPDKDFDLLRFEGVDDDPPKVPAHIPCCLLGEYRAVVMGCDSRPLVIIPSQGVGCLASGVSERGQKPFD